MPSQNRPVVKDGRLVVKKRTDRSYLKPSAAEPEIAAPDVLPETDAPVVDETTPVATSAATAAFTAPTAAPAAPPASAPTPAPAAKSATARALEQQGVRKRREVDLDAVARRDSNYAMHELRRIAILTAIVIAVLVILTLTLR